MPTLEFFRDFVLQLEDGTTRFFKAGVQEVEQVFAEHWYVKANTTGPLDPAAKEPLVLQKEGETIGALHPQDATAQAAAGVALAEGPAEPDKPTRRDRKP